jgi:serine/threonine protein kinase
MATVWEAEHMTLGSPVAVKFLAAPQGARHAKLAERFMREARVAASVRHRNVIEIIDFGIEDANVPYMVMEMLEGEGLDARLMREGRLHVGAAVQIMWLSLRGLAAVHDAGIVHRDMKPENIFLVDDPDGAFPKILDFGVSRRAADADITQEGFLVGTPDYMSPEQAKGIAEIDARTDLYSMGVILYEAIAGRLPFEADSSADVLAKIAKDEPPPLASLRPGISEALCDVIARAMHKDPEERFQDAREMRWALAEASTEYGLSPERESGVSRISEFPQTGSGLTPKLPNGEDVTEAEIPLPAGDTEEILIERSEWDGKPVSVPPSVAPGKGRGALRLLLLSTALAAAIGVALAVTLPDSPLFFGERDDEATAAAPWEPVTGIMPLPVLDAGADAPAEVRVALHELPDGGVATIEGVGIEGTVAWLPERSADYHVEVRANGAPLWSVEHPGNVDGEYAVSATVGAELAKARSPSAMTGRRPRRGGGRGPRR